MGRDLQAQAGAAALVVEVQYFFQAAEGAVVHIGAGEGGVADGWGFEGAFEEGEGVDLITALIGAELEPCFGDCAGLGAGGFCGAGDFGVGGCAGLGVGFAEVVGAGGTEDFEFGLGIIGGNEAVEKGDEMAGGALGFAHE